MCLSRTTWAREFSGPGSEPSHPVSRVSQRFHHHLELWRSCCPGEQTPSPAAPLTHPDFGNTRAFLPRALHPCPSSLRENTYLTSKNHFKYSLSQENILPTFLCGSWSISPLTLLSFLIPFLSSLLIIYVPQLRFLAGKNIFHSL